MFSPDELQKLQASVEESVEYGQVLLDELREEVRPLALEAKAIEPREMAAMSLVAGGSGIAGLVFDPFNVILVRVVDSSGEALCLDVVTPTSDTDVLSAKQFNVDGTPRTALGGLMIDLRLRPRTLHSLSHMIPDAGQIRRRPERVSPSWVQAYQELCEWAALYERVVKGSFAADTLFVKDGLLRSKIFRGALFMDMMRLIEKGIERCRAESGKRVFLAGLARRSKVLDRYNLAMSLEGVFPPGAPRCVPIPRALEAKAYVWPDYARGPEAEGGPGEAPKFVAGDMHLVRFGPRSGDPIWPVDVLSAQADFSQEVFACLLNDSIAGFPVPFYPRCLQKARAHAEITDFDLDIFQNGVRTAIRRQIKGGEAGALDCLMFMSEASDGGFE